MLRSEFATLEHKENEMNNDVLKEILEDLANLEKDFKKIELSDRNEHQYLRQQVSQIVTEKTSIQQKTLLLENRVSSAENDVGFE